MQITMGYSLEDQNSFPNECKVWGFFFHVAALCWVNQLCCFCNSNDTLYFFVLHFFCQKKQYSIGYVAFLSTTNLNYYVGFFYGGSMLFG